MKIKIIFLTRIFFKCVELRDILDFLSWIVWKKYKLFSIYLSLVICCFSSKCVKCKSKCEQKTNNNKSFHQDRFLDNFDSGNS